jgi:hypothetical protein
MAEIDALNKLDAFNEVTLKAVEQDNAIPLFPRLRAE